MICTGLRGLRAILCAALAVSTAVLAQPQPGDVFREYPLLKAMNSCPDVLAPDCGSLMLRVKPTETRNFEIPVADLDQAVRAEIDFAISKCDGGRSQFMLNDDGVWTDIPIPEQALKYLYLVHPTVPIELSRVRADTTFIKLRNSAGSQNLVFTIILRVYYESSKPHPSATLATPSSGSSIGFRPTFSIQADLPEQIRKVDYVGYYTDYSWEGDGVYTRWHGHWLYCARMINIVGRACDGPGFAATWDNVWLPDQTGPMQFSARVIGTDGIVYMVPAVTGITLERAYSVELCKPYDISQWFNTRWREGVGCSFDIAGPRGLDKADSARLYLTTWGPSYNNEEIFINGTVVDSLVNDSGHAYISWSPDYHETPYDHIKDFSVAGTGALRPGVNELTTERGDHHGVEIQYPGPALLVRYDYDPSLGSLPPARGDRSRPVGPGRMQHGETAVYGIDGRMLRAEAASILSTDAGACSPGVFVVTDRSASGQPARTVVVGH